MFRLGDNQLEGNLVVIPSSDSLRTEMLHQGVKRVRSKGHWRAEGPLGARRAEWGTQAKLTELSGLASITVADNITMSN